MTHADSGTVVPQRLVVRRASGLSTAAPVCPVDPAALELAGLQELGVATFDAHGRRQILTRVTGDEALRGSGVCELERQQLSLLKVSPGGVVTMTRAKPVESRRVVLEPLVPLDRNLAAYEEEVGAELVRRQTLVQNGMLVPLRISDFRRDVLFRVSSTSPACGWISDETRVVLRASMLPPGVASNLVDFDDVGGLDAEISRIRELVEYPLVYPQVYEQVGIDAPRGILLHGPPGVGKTHLARAVANEIQAHFVYVNGPEILSAIQGGTEANLRAIFEEAMENTPAIVMIDELDAIAPRRKEAGITDGRVGTQLLSLLDGLVSMAGVVVIATSNRPEALDPALRRPGRFDRELLLRPPNPAGRLEILQIHTRAMPLSSDAQEFLPELAKSTHGYSGADLVNLVRESGLQAVRRQVRPGLRGPDTADLPSWSVTAGDLRHGLAETGPSSMRQASSGASRFGWSDVVGLREEVDYLRSVVEMPLRHPEAFQDVGLGRSSGLVLHGPPGTGKTLLALAAAHESGANVVTLNGPEIFSKWLGQSEEAIRDAFELARLAAPSVVILDQLDAMAPRRSSESSNSAAQRVVDQLLVELDSTRPGELVVVGITNRLDLIDPALLRPGRLGAKLAIGLPDLTARRAILVRHLRTAAATDPAGWDVTEHVAVSSDGYSGADLVAVVDTARLIALRRADFARGCTVTEKHLEEAYQTYERDSPESSMDGEPARPGQKG